ncbi:MAG: hypothetical protein ONB06_09550, partial [candidate division KSB1 bacterium]|nr:hypothetical protein [candidate division KSB1 bacterium]
VVLANALASCCLLLALTSRLGLTWAAAGCYVGLYQTWVLASEGRHLLLEPYAVGPQLLAFLLLSGKTRTPASVVGAGALAGFSVLAKQYSLLAFPGLSLLAVGAGGSRPGSHSRRLVLGALFLVAAPLPWMAYCIGARVPLWDSLVHLATFGGRATDYGAGGVRALAHAVCGGKPCFTILWTAAAAGL